MKDGNTTASYPTNDPLIGFGWRFTEVGSPARYTQLAKKRQTRRKFHLQIALCHEPCLVFQFIFGLQRNTFDLVWNYTFDFPEVLTCTPLRCPFRSELSTGHSYPSSIWIWYLSFVLELRLGGPSRWGSWGKPYYSIANYCAVFEYKGRLRPSFAKFYFNFIWSKPCLQLDSASEFCRYSV